MNSKDQLTVFECIRCKTFSTDGSLTIEKQHEQMRQHLDVAHAYWELENIGVGSQNYKSNFSEKTLQRSSQHFCSNCGILVSSSTKICSGCGVGTTEFSETNRVQFDSLNKTSATTIVRNWRIDSVVHWGLHADHQSANCWKYELLPER